MKHTYKITGMTCQGCQAKVENALNDIDGISAKVTLEPAEATITMDQHVASEKLQEALSAIGNYTIEMAGHSMKAR
jgi:Cu2+-exporting ATPase